MTVPAAVTAYRYQGNGVTTIFAYSNRLLTTADVKVQILTRATDAIVETLMLTTDYTVTLVSNSLANITITNPAKIPSITQDILLSLDIDISQTRSYPRADLLPAADIERGLDKLTLIAQLQDDGQTRNLRFPVSDTTTDGELPARGDRASKYLAFNAGGEPVASAGTDTITSPYGLSLVQASDDAAARVILGTDMTKAVYDPANIAQQLVGTTAVQTITNKTMAFASNTFTGFPTGGKPADGRLSLTSGVPVTTANVVGATNIHYVPYIGNSLALYNGSTWDTLSFTNTTFALGTMIAGRGYDVFAFNNSGVLTLEIEPWTSSTARFKLLTRQDGVLVQLSALTRRYLGSFYAPTTTTTEDSAANRYVWNYYNRIDRFGERRETADSWTYSTAAYRQANANTSNQINFFIGVSEDPIEIDLRTLVTSSGATARATYSAIGVDSVTVATRFMRTDVAFGGTIYLDANPKYVGYVAEGLRYVSWLEFGGGADTQTWLGGTSADTGLYLQIRG